MALTFRWLGLMNSLETTMTKPKRFAYLQELRSHLTQLGYPQHIINQQIQDHPWSPQFARTAPNGISSAKRA